MVFLIAYLIRSSYTFRVSSFFFLFYHFTDGRTTWTSDQFVARPLPKHRTTQTQNKHIHIPNIHILCGILTHDPGFRESEDSSCLRPLGYRDRHIIENMVCYDASLQQVVEYDTDTSVMGGEIPRSSSLSSI
jgi:hypothetical protein